MSSDKNGGPAFPVPLNPGEGYSGHCPADGMTLRDYFAAKALPALISSCGNGVSFGPDSPDSNFKFANVAYVLADAMLRARATAPQEGS